MKNYYLIYIETDKYLSEYITKHFGVAFPADEETLFPSDKKYIEFSNTSPEQKILFRFMNKLPVDKEPDRPTETSIAIRLPMRKEKHPRDGYTYFSESAKRHLINHMIAILETHLIKDYLEAFRDSPDMNITDYVYAWCELNGIDVDDGKSPEAIRQKIYRIRKTWKKENEINLV